MNKIIIIYLIALIILFSVSFSTIYAEEQCAEFTRYNDRLKFEIDRPVKGTYSESEDISLTIGFYSSARVSLNASELTYKGGQENIKVGSYPLSVMYFVQFDNQNKYSFIPNSTLTLPVKFAKNSSQTFNFTGNINIQSLSSQPAGKYEGIITVTVSSYE